ncbi:MARVEL domain-containing protein 3 [Aegotheles albertisi]
MVSVCTERASVRSSSAHRCRRERAATRPRNTALRRGRAPARSELFTALGRAPKDAGHPGPRRDPTPRRHWRPVGRPRARPSLPSAGGAGPRRAVAGRSSPRAPRASRTGAGRWPQGARAADGTGLGSAGRGGQAAVRCPGGPLLSPPPSPLSAMPGAGLEGPPRGRAAAPGLLECHRCRYLRTGRACCQVAEALLAVLILVCSSVSYGSTGGYTGLPSLGGIYYYHYGGAYSGFSGADGDKAQQLDQRLYLLKLPVARAAMAVGGCLLLFSCVLLLVGVLRLPWRFPAWLLLECILDVVIAVGIVPALYYFFHFLLGAYNSSVCKEREQLYQSKGYQGFRCSLHGAEIAAGLSGCLAVVAYLLSAGLAVRGYRTVHKWKQKPVQLYKL